MQSRRGLEPRPEMRPMAETFTRYCQRCGLAYDWRRSPSSSLKMTYCCSLCERANLGFTIEALLGNEWRPFRGLAIV